ncbi:thioredoxin-disulfide reductase [Candidatus Woesearchaeota archaeon]|nr:thioredoxin-disulfide reductase [Candidatus Woesearchaeota archaeon]
MEFYDVVIIGGGAAGLTSAIYSCRKSLKTLLIKGPHPGGETALTKNIENYPGYEKGSGSELMDSFERQAKKFGTEFIEDLVINVSKKSNKFLVKLESNKEFESKTVILAFGRKRRKLNIPGEDKFLGRGLSTCTICDAPLFAKKVVAVIGGGNSAVEGAVELSSIAKKTFLIHRREDFKADEITVKEMKKKKNVELVLNTMPLEILGENFVTGLKIKDLKTNKEKTIPLEGVFTEIGYDTDTTIVKDMVDKNELGEIIVDLKCKTKTPGLFAAGDLTLVPYKQTVISAGQGSIAALEAHKYILELKRK